MTIVIGWAFAQKSDVKVVTQSPVFANKTDVDAGFARLNDKIDKLSERCEVWGTRVWLLGLAHNENINIQQRQDYQRFGVADSGYIFFDENWRLNRMPRSLQLSEESRDYLQKIVK
jgi:hypothetical protein